MLEPCAESTVDNKKIHTGLIVYNTEETLVLKKGMHVWNGELWQPLNGKGNIGIGPWYKVGTTKPAIKNDSDSYLNAKAVVGGTTVIDDSQLSVHGSVNIKTGGVSGGAVGGFKLTDGNEGLGRALVSDEHGNASWQELATNIPIFSQIDGFSHTQVLAETPGIVQFKGGIVKKADGTPFYIEVPTSGVYSFTIGAYIQLLIPIPAGMSNVIMQLLPEPDMRVWNNQNGYGIRFKGSYEIYGVVGGNSTEYRFYLSENLVINNETGRRVYIAIAVIGGVGSLNEIPVKFSLGSFSHDQSVCPQCSGGSYLRISNKSDY